MDWNLPFSKKLDTALLWVWNLNGMLRIAEVYSIYIYVYWELYVFFIIRDIKGNLNLTIFPIV